MTMDKENGKMTNEEIAKNIIRPYSGTIIGDLYKGALYAGVKEALDAKDLRITQLEGEVERLQYKNGEILIDFMASKDDQRTAFGMIVDFIDRLRSENTDLQRKLDLAVKALEDINKLSWESPECYSIIQQTLEEIKK